MPARGSPAGGPRLARLSQRTLAAGSLGSLASQRARTELDRKPNRRCTRKARQAPVRALLEEAFSLWTRSPLRSWRRTGRHVSEPKIVARKLRIGAGARCDYYFGLRGCRSTGPLPSACSWPQLRLPARLSARIVKAPVPSIGISIASARQRQKCSGLLFMRP
jgi:hypothetical protein